MLALWEFFWDINDWLGITPSIPVEVIPESRGGGHKRSNNYIGPSPDFWLVRDRYLRQVLHPALHKVPVPHEVSEVAEAASRNAPPPKRKPTKTELTAAALALRRRDKMLALARSSTTAAELRAAVAATIAFTLALQAQLEQYYMRAAIILLLDIF